MNYGVSIMEMTKYFQQHQDVLALLKDIESKIRAPDAVPIDLADSLIYFSARLKHHLAMEDMFLYPKAIGSVDTDFKQLASKMHAEMVPISKLFVAYIECWGPKQIEKDRARFTTDTADICAALRTRIAAEEAKFYPMAEKLL
ncbi:MAG: hemerythrin domain-containing protein [Alphaproteobacteria bacterium]|nr:hemerythrin domain-containing protein [Alphaproteobacteria bacterium]